jgi:hypothetical protein
MINGVQVISPPQTDAKAAFLFIMSPNFTNSDDVLGATDKDEESQYIRLREWGYRIKISAIYSEKALDRGRSTLI